MDYVGLILLALAWAIGTPILAIVALVRTSGLREANERLTREVAALRRQIGAGTVAAAPEAVATLPPPFVAEPVAEAPPTAPVATTGPEVEAVAASAPPAEPVEPTVPPSAAVAPAAVVPDASAKADWEQRLGARAFIWVGAVTLALAAIFLVRYSIEEGYLSPEVRVILAALFGFALIAGAEKMRPRDARVAQAMAAAGVAALYGALFSAVALYDMISRVAAGGGAAALTAFAIGVALRHGIFVAGLAFIGGFVSPAIVGSQEPNTAVLFGYLLALAAGALWAIRLRGWWLLGWGVLAGSVAWTGVWMLTLPENAFLRGPHDLHWVSFSLVAVAALFVWVTWRRMAEKENPPTEVTALVWTALGVTGALLVALIVQDSGQQTAGWLALAGHGIGLYALGRRSPRFQYVAALAPVLSLAALAGWWVTTDGTGVGWADGDFAWLCGLLGGLYAIGAFALMWNAGRPGFWAALSVTSALSHFLLCWFVLRTVDSEAPWGLISVGLAAPFLVGAERVSHWRQRMTGATEALGYLAAGVSFFVAAAIPLELSREWITVAYAVELAAVAFISARLDLIAMRRLCWGLLAVVVVRFVLNPEILDYPLGVTPLFNWILWGYGISIAALAVGAHQLRATRADRLAEMVEAATFLLVFVLVTLEVRSFFQPDNMSVDNSTFMERTFYVLVWGAFALAALRIAQLRNDPVTLWAWRASAVLAAGTALFVQVLIANPVSMRAGDLGQWPIANGLLLAYAVPAAMAALAQRWLTRTGDRQGAVLAGVTASILAFAYVSLEVRHFFDPGFQRYGFEADGIELYSYSIVWLLFGVALLALGFARGTAALRHAGMALVCIVIAKVFLIDMAGLHGLLRVVSFLGLGAALLGLGYAYRRLDFDPKSPE